MKHKVVVIGAGPAGLTAAYELLSRSDEYSVFEYWIAPTSDFIQELRSALPEITVLRPFRIRSKLLCPCQLIDLRNTGTYCSYPLSQVLGIIPDLLGGLVYTVFLFKL